MARTSSTTRTATTTATSSPPAASFIDTEDDHNVVDPPVRPRGWSEDGRYVLLSDNWDVWRVAVQGDAGTNLTGNGKTDQIRYQALIQFDPDDKPGYDLSKPLYFRTYGEWTKKSGYSLMTRGRPGLEVLAWEDRSYGALTKAEDAEVYLMSWTTWKDYPNWHVTDARLASPRQLTDGYPEQADFLWSAGARLVDYTSDKGDRLQAALYLPAGYEEGKSYPTIVYIYEKLSQGLNSYAFPSANGFNQAYYTSNGYAVLTPDITYQVNDPGMSAVWCVLPALEAAVRTGVVDRAKVGIHGHSWGGYQTAFLVTQTNAFAAVATGAPLTNMISMYASIYWNSGGADGAIFESSQGRFLGGPWDHLEAYARNSPVYHAENIQTPILLLHNDQDGAVDWNQGIEYYNTIRRMGKPIVMLQYVGENHGVAKAPNRKDYTVRMKEFFDHYLKGAPAPQWWTEGVSHLKMDDHIKERIHLVRPPEKKPEGGAQGRSGGR
jgi:dipeptidyl aminopeptidase/acylaminoacyl peptidase